jgi:hypothetical protein
MATPTTNTDKPRTERLEYCSDDAGLYYVTIYTFPLRKMMMMMMMMMMNPIYRRDTRGSLQGPKMSYSELGYQMTSFSKWQWA